MKIVTDGDQFSIKKGWWIFARFLDFVELRHNRRICWWFRGNRHFPDCWTDNAETVHTWLRRLKV